MLGKLFMKLGKLFMKLGKLFLVAGQTILEGRCKLYQEKNKLSQGKSQTFLKKEGNKFKKCEQIKKSEPTYDVRELREHTHKNVISNQ